MNVVGWVWATRSPGSNISACNPMLSMSVVGEVWATKSPGSNISACNPRLSMM